MGKALIIGCGGVASVAIHKCCQNSEVFEEICIASRTVSKCDALKEKLQGSTKTKITTAQVNADNVEELIELINREKPDVVLNLALPYQDLTIMDACLATRTHYVDTANYEPEDTAKFEYSWQWAYRERFEKAGITALLGSGFDPGVTGVFSAYALKHEFDEINYIDILDCNGGDHGYPFATNFNPEINIREVSANGSYWEDGHWVETKPMEIKRVYNFEEVGEKDMYLLHHEEIESLALNIPGIKRIRFFMTFGQSYLTHLKCLENVGMTSIEPIMFEGKEIVPLQFLKAVLPDPASLGPRTKGKTNIGCIFQGKKDGKEKKYYLYNICDHEKCYAEVGSQAVAYTTGVPAMIGAMMIMTGKWNKPKSLYILQTSLRLALATLLCRAHPPGTSCCRFSRRQGASAKAPSLASLSCRHRTTRKGRPLPMPTAILASWLSALYIVQIGTHKVQVLVFTGHDKVHLALGIDGKYLYLPIYLVLVEQLAGIAKLINHIAVRKALSTHDAPKALVGAIQGSKAPYRFFCCHNAGWNGALGKAVYRLVKRLENITADLTIIHAEHLEHRADGCTYNNVLMVGRHAYLSHVIPYRPLVLLILVYRRIGCIDVLHLAILHSHQSANIIIAETIESLVSYMPHIVQSIFRCTVNPSSFKHIASVASGQNTI